jgi:hypothetical protein
MFAVFGRHIDSMESMAGCDGLAIQLTMPESLSSMNLQPRG